MESPDAPQDTEPVAIFKKRSTKGKSSFRKRAATPPPASDSDSANYSSSEDESGHKIKRRKRNTGAITASSKSNPISMPDLVSTPYAADRSATIKSSNDATKQSNWYDENATDALSSKNLLGTTRAKPEAADGTYKGLANATTFIQKNPNAPTRVVGPVKAPTNIRTITVTDFAPDVCKDVSPLISHYLFFSFAGAYSSAAVSGAAICLGKLAPQFPSFYFRSRKSHTNWIIV
jgi:RING finger protein 113A